MLSFRIFKSKKVIILSSILTLILITSAFFILLNLNKPKPTNIETPHEKVLAAETEDISPTPTLTLSPLPISISVTFSPTIKPTIKATAPLPAVKSYKFQNVIGWIASFDYTRGKNVFYDNISKYTEVSPVYYDLNTNGTTSARSVAGDIDLITKAHKNKVKISPTIISFDENALQAMLNDDTKYKAHNDYLISEVDKYGYDGIDIDYESINLTDKDKYISMLKDLAELLHAKGKILSVSVVPKAMDSGYTTLIETRQVQDWTEITKYVDELRVMAYDYSPADTSGPVSPVWWVENILKYAKDKNALSKLILGQPFYGYAYSATNRYAYTYDEIADIIKTQNLTPEYDDYSGEKILRFKKGTEDRKMYYQDGETFERRFELADKYKVQGVSFWRLGGEDNNIYSRLDKQR